MLFNYTRYTISELKKMCKEDDLDQSGTKQELMQRLETHMMIMEAELLGELPPVFSTSATAAPTNNVTINGTSSIFEVSEADLGEFPQQLSSKTIKTDNLATSIMSKSQSAKIDAITKQASTTRKRRIVSEEQPLLELRSERPNGRPPALKKMRIDTQKAPQSSELYAQQKQNSTPISDVQNQVDCSSKNAISSATTLSKILITTEAEEAKTGAATIKVVVINEEARKRAARAQQFGIVSPELLTRQFEQKNAEGTKRFRFIVVPDRSTTQSSLSSSSTVTSEQRCKFDAREERSIETRRHNREDRYQKIKKRAERFKIPLVSKGGTIKWRVAVHSTVYDPEHQEKLRKRAERFKIPLVSEGRAMKRRAVIHSTVYDPEHQEKLRKRAERFGHTLHAL